jgi:hypothetical protein
MLWFMRVERKEATRYSKFAKKRAAAQWELQIPLSEGFAWY